MLGAGQKLAGLVLERAAGIEFEVSLNVGDDGRRIVLTLVNSGEEDVDVGQDGIARERVEGALQRLRDLAERVLNESQTIFADGRAWVEEKTLANKGFRVGKLGALVEDHGETEERGGKAAASEVNGGLEILGSGVELAEVVVGQAKIVVRTIGGGSQLDDSGEVGETGFGIAL